MYPTSARFRDAVRGSHRVVANARICSAIQFGPHPTGLELPLRSGTVRMASTQDIKATLDVQVPGDYWDSLQPYGAEIFVERGVDFGDGTSELVPLGYFRVESVEQDNAPAGPLKVTGRDRVAQLKDVRLVYPYQYPAGITHRQLFERMVNGYTDPTAGPGGGPLLIAYGMYFAVDVPIIFRAYDGDKAKLPTGVIEGDVYDALAKIVDARGAVIRFARTGELEVVARDTPAGTPTVYDVAGGQTGTLIRRSRGTRRAGVYNIVVARGSDPAAPVGYRLAYNDDATSPLWWRGPFGPVPRYYSSPLVRSSDQAQSAADSVLARYRGLPREEAAALVPDPALDALDPVRFLVETPVVHTIDELTIPITNGAGNLEIKTRSLNEVPETGDEDDGAGTGGGTDGGGGGGGQDPGDGGDPGSGAGGPPVYPATFPDGVAFPLFTEPAGQQTVPVANTSELTSKVAAAKPGQTLVLADGTYSPGTLTISAKGTKTQPIVVRPLNPGQVKWASGSGIRITGEWILVKDIDKDVDDSGKSFSFEGAARFCGYDGMRVGPASLGAPQPSAAKSLHYYAGGDASDCFFTYCETRGKSKPGNGFLVDGNFSTFKACAHILIDHPYVHDYGTEVVNDFEAIRYGVSTMQTTVVNSAIIRGVFKNVATEPEIISIKACKVASWGHTVENCVGSLSIRHGDDNFHRDCYVVGPATGARGTKAGGARVYGKRNAIEFCYFQDLNGSSYESTLTIDGGDTSSPTNGHQNVVGGRFTNNVGVNCATAIVIGEHYSTAPKDITVTGARFAACGGQAIRTVKAPTGTNTISDNTHYATLAEAQAAGMTGPTDGAYRFPGRGPRLTRLSVADVGRAAARTDGTGVSIGGASGGTPGGVSPQLQAAQAILDRITAGQPIGADWTWTGAPAVVATHGPGLRTQFTSSGSTSQTTWLQTYISSGGTNTTGGVPGSGTASTIAALLKIGMQPGEFHANVGIGFAPGDDVGPNADGNSTVSGAVHRDYSPARQVQGLVIPGYHEFSADRTRARLSVPLNGGRTSNRTKYPRDEWRAYDLDGSKMAFNPNKGTHYIIIRARALRFPPDKPEMVACQFHDASDDTAMIRFRNKTTVEAKLGDTVLGNLTTSYVFGQDYTAMIKVIGDGSKCKLEYYWNDMSSPKFTTGSATRSTGWYEKAGLYAQSWGGPSDSRGEPTDAVEDGPFIIEVSGIGHWHSQSPASGGQPWPEPLGLKP